MYVPIVSGIIDRRILINYRVDTEVLAKILPPPFQPKTVGGAGIAGVCLIRLKQVRPRLLPALVGISSENAAHRIAVEWEQNGERCEGVYIPRRDTSSVLNTLAGGRLFPGIHHHARFSAHEQDGQYSVTFDSDDGRTHLAVEGHVAPDLPASSVFGSLPAASDFFRKGSLEYSPSRNCGKYDGLQLHTFDWSMQPLAIDRVESSYFEDRSLFPAGAVEFDCALLMRYITHQWHSRPAIFPDIRDKISHDPSTAAMTEQMAKPISEAKTTGRERRSWRSDGWFPRASSGDLYGFCSMLKF